MIRVLVVLSMMGLGACASAPKTAISERPRVEWAPVVRQAEGRLPVYYAAPRAKFKTICRIEASGGNFLASRFTRKADFETQFRRRAQKCKGANAVVIENMFAFEHGSAFADGVAIAIEPGT